jgi:hypothetical protein
MRVNIEFADGIPNARAPKGSAVTIAELQTGASVILIHRKDAAFLFQAIGSSLEGETPE